MESTTTTTTTTLDYSLFKKEDVVNKDYLELVDKIVTCPICCEIIDSPMQCQTCQFCFCESCLEEWKIKNDYISNPFCPFKCKEAKFVESKICQKILDDLVFKCPLGCEETISYKEIKKHVDIKCPKIDFKERYIQSRKEIDELKKKLKKYEDDEKYLQRQEDIIKDFNLKSKYHHHKLGLVTTTRGGFNCDICRSSHYGKDKSYYCTLCDFDLCEACGRKEKTMEPFASISS